MDIPPKLVRELIETGASTSATQLLELCGRRLTDQIKNDLDSALRSPRQDERVFGIARLLLNICYGADTEAGAPLAAATLDFLVHGWSSLQFENPKHLQHLCVATLTACIYAHYQEGYWNACPHFLEKATAFSFAKELVGYWNAPALVARIMLAENRIVEAKKLLDQIPFRESDQADHVALAHQELSSFIRKRFELDARLKIADQANVIWERVFAENLSVLDQLSHTISNAPDVQVISFGLADLIPLKDQLEEMQRIATTAMSFEEKYARLSALNERWRETMFLLLNPKADLGRVTAEWVSRVSDRASYIHAAPQPDRQEAEACLNDLVKARDWSFRCGDWHRFWLADWARILVFERLEQRSDCIEIIRSLVHSINEKRAVTDDIEVRSNISNYLPGLAGKACKLCDPIDDISTLFAACELRKSRSLLASKSSASSVLEPGTLGPLALGERTHYLSYTAFHEDNFIQACLYTSDGMIGTQRLEVSVETVKGCIERLDPAKWNSFRFIGRPTPPQALAPLLFPLEAAIGAGRIRFGDHVCIAADDPVNLVPLHYLTIAGELAVKRVSMSRVASFADARMLADERTFRPLRSASIFSPTVSKNPGRFDDFNGVAQVLAAELPLHEVTADGPISADGVIDTLRTDSVIHLYAHGAFKPDANPHTNSGLVVSDGNGLPYLDGHPDRLLTPKHLIENRKPALSGSHVTLSACVSGLGLEGQGGDVLGLEMALRLCGASSVLATHWNVKWSDASVFSREFYRRWLGENISRGEAWRQTVEALMNREKSPSRATEWCAFSLFGGWR